MAVPPDVTPRRARDHGGVAGRGHGLSRRVLAWCVGGLLAVSVIGVDIARSAPAAEGCAPQILTAGNTIELDPTQQANEVRELYQVRRELRALCQSIEAMGHAYGDAVRADLWFLAGSLLGLVGLGAMAKAARF